MEAIIKQPAPYETITLGIVHNPYFHTIDTFHIPTDIGCFTIGFSVSRPDILFYSYTVYNTSRTAVLRLVSGCVRQQNLERHRPTILYGVSYP